MSIDEAIRVLIAIERYPTNIKGKDEAIEMAISTLRAQQEAEQNEPLTLDELRTMDGQPVWAVLEIYGMSQIHAYAIVDSECECVKGLKCFLLFEDYGSWLAYRFPPENARQQMCV